MSKKRIQFIYEPDPDNHSKIHWLWNSEVKAMEAAGFCIGTKPMKEIPILIFRGSRSLAKKKYKKDKRYINNFKHIVLYGNMSNYHEIISDLSIETFFVNKLNEKAELLIIENGWNKVFIRNDEKSLEHIEYGKSLWPHTSLKEMKKFYDEMNVKGKFAIRKFIESDVIDKEERYWVINGNIYHRHNKIPEVVKEAARRLNKLGSRYYTIDATPEFVVEVNPGESSDRHAVNSAELFASWFKREFGT